MKRMALLLLAISMAAAATGCGNNADVPAQPDASQTEETAGEPISIAGNAQDTILTAPDYDQPNESAEKIAQGANAFAFDFTSALLENAEEGNFLCSPFSAWLPLAALSGACDDASKAGLLSALGVSDVSEEDIHNAVSRMLYDLTRQRENEEAQEYGGTPYNPLQIANAIFVDQGASLNGEFSGSFSRNYLGQAMNVNFSSNEAVDAVNEWAKEHTDGRIEQIVESFDADTQAALANAIYFSDRWESEFDPGKTKEDVFYGSAEESTADYMLKEGDALYYYEDEQVQAMPLDFMTGGGMLILLPKEGEAAEFISGMDEAYFQQILEQAWEGSGKLLLPKFHISSDAMRLNEALESMGVALFDKERPHITGLIEGMPVFLSEAVQKAVIEVDEKGTTAAAVTVMAAAGSSLPIPTEPFEMNCNRPFAFILYAQTHDGGAQVLFTGVVNKP